MLLSSFLKSGKENLTITNGMVPTINNFLTAVDSHWYFVSKFFSLSLFCPTVNNRTHSFTLSGNTLGQNPVTSMVGGVGPNACNADWLIIPCASNVGRVNTGTASTCVDRICGGTFNSEVSVTPATVYSKYLFTSLIDLSKCYYSIISSKAYACKYHIRVCRLS